MPYVRKLANKGWKQAMRENEPLRLGLNIADKKVTFPDIAEQFNYPYTPAESLLN
jgi:alanine dehydrogenase